MDFQFTRKSAVIFAISIVITYTIIDLLENQLLTQQWQFSLLEPIAQIFLLYTFYYLFAKEPKEQILTMKPTVFFFGLLLFILIGMLPVYLQVEQFLIRIGGIVLGVGMMLGFFRLVTYFQHN